MQQLHRDGCEQQKCHHAQGPLHSHRNLNNSPLRGTTLQLASPPGGKRCHDDRQETRRHRDKRVQDTKP
jgi:hypothetical protein